MSTSKQTLRYSYIPCPPKGAEYARYEDKTELIATGSAESYTWFNQYLTNGIRESHNCRLRRIQYRLSSPEVRPISLLRYFSSWENSLMNCANPNKRSIRKPNATNPTRRQSAESFSFIECATYLRIRLFFICFFFEQENSSRSSIFATPKMAKTRNAIVPPTKTPTIKPNIDLNSLIKLGITLCH